METPQPKIPEGYRLLEDWEVIREGDLIASHPFYNNKEVTDSIGSTIQEFRISQYYPEFNVIRKVSPSSTFEDYTRDLELENYGNINPKDQKTQGS